MILASAASLAGETHDRFPTLEFLKLQRGHFIDKFAYRHTLAVSLDLNPGARGGDMNQSRSEDVGALALPHEGELELPLVWVSVQVIAELGINRVGFVSCVAIEASGHVPHIRFQRLDLVLVPLVNLDHFSVELAHLLEQLDAGLIRLVVLLFELDDVVRRGLDLPLQGLPVVEQRLIFLL